MSSMFQGHRIRQLIKIAILTAISNKLAAAHHKKRQVLTAATSLSPDITGCNSAQNVLGEEPAVHLIMMTNT
jgi:hypothetical protein